MSHLIIFGVFIVANIIFGCIKGKEDIKIASDIVDTGVIIFVCWLFRG